jgi:hypothetical protein
MGRERRNGEEKIFTGRSREEPLSGRFSGSGPRSRGKVLKQQFQAVVGGKIVILLFKANSRVKRCRKKE